jgi:hydroxymethylpyrimidine pyrophosphatase-like HAD family hydrolase
LGRFANASLAVARCLREFIPAVYGAQGGLIFREWLDGDARLTRRLNGEHGNAHAAAIGRYVAARRRRLRLAEDLSFRLSGDAVWEEIAVMLARTLGAPGAAYLAARPLARLSARRLLAVREPALIDGDMRLDHWFATDHAPPALVKTGTWRSRYSERNLYSGDWALDLAAAAADLERRGLADLVGELRTAAERDLGSPVDDARWLLYRLVDHLIEYETCLRRAGANADGPHDFERALALERLMARICRGYVADSFFADLASSHEGPLCAVDIDGVLEERWLAFPVIAPAAALALRALNRHGCRVVLATGRSLGEVRERCVAYRLAGGVAEYGAAIYDHRTGREQSLVTEADREHLSALRHHLSAEPRVHLDPDHRHAIRAHAIDPQGRRGGLGVDSIEAALACAPPGLVHAVRGDLQTDFVPAGIDKGSGLRALAERAGGADHHGQPVALAIGDSDADVAMFAAAERAFAPANATAGAAAVARRLRKPYANGLLAAAAAFIGHAPGQCSRCRPIPPRSSDAALLLSWLGALNGGRAGKASSLFAVTAQLVRGAHP